MSNKVEVKYSMHDLIFDVVIMLITMLSAAKWVKKL